MLIFLHVHTIYIEKAFSDVSENFMLCEKVFNSERCLTCYIKVVVLVKV